MYFYYLTLTIIVLIQITKQEFIGQNDTTTSKSLVRDRKKMFRTGDMKTNNTIYNKNFTTPPIRLLYEYLRCHHLNPNNKLPTPYSCSNHFEEDTRLCWKATPNGTFATNTIEYNHGLNHFYDGVHYGIENCTLQRFCQNNGTWLPTVSPDIQCKICFGDAPPLKFNSISIMIETISLTLSLLSLTIAVLCMINVKRLHLPRNLLHMNLFVAFIFRSIVKLVFIHSIVGGYTRTMIVYDHDKCGNIEILAKSSNLFHVIGCRILASLYWYTDAVFQTFIFCEAMFLFTALTSHLFRDRGCLVFVLWGWLSPLVWLTMWIISHIITDKYKNRSTCWLEADNTTYFLYFFFVPYAFYLLINFGIFLYLVRLLYSKYQSTNMQTKRTGNRHLIKSILILIPLFGLHSLFVMWVFHHKNEGHTIWYYIVVIFKAVFGDLQGFFTSLIYFYFNTEIRQEVLRQIQRSLSNKDAVGRSSTGDTLSTRLSIFRISTNRQRHSSIRNRKERSRTTNTHMSPRIVKTRQLWWKKYISFLCPCLFTKTKSYQQNPSEQLQSIEPTIHKNEILSSNIPNIILENDLNGVTSLLINENHLSKGRIDNEGVTCDTLIKTEHENEAISDANDITFHQTSFSGEHTSNHTPIEIHKPINDDNHLQEILSTDFIENKPLKR